MSKSAPPITVETETATEPEKLEAYIPYLRKDIIDVCLKDGSLPESEREGFQELCELLTAYLHFEFHQYAEEVKECYAPFDPDIDTIFLDEPEATPENEERVAELYRSLAERANFFEVSEDDIESALHETSLIDLDTTVDMNDFDRVMCFARGDRKQKVTVKKLFRKREFEIESLQRVLLLFKFKNEEYFNSSKK
ncbi:MAG: hypothetical protein ACI8UO_006720, partial [Verrucomicrobiales bacterium]